MKTFFTQLALMVSLFVFHHTTISQTVIFSETFSRGLLGDSNSTSINGPWTTNGNSNYTPNSLAIWEYRGPNTTPNHTMGSRGGFAGNTGPIVSPTVSNGFMIFDSDYADNNGISTNLGQGNAPAPHESWLISSPFSTIGQSDISIQINTFYRRYAGEGYLLLSNDSGATWGDTITIFDINLGINIAGANNELVVENINYIANVANARIAFFFDGVTTQYASGGGYYYYMVDDIKITETPDNNLRYESYWFNTPADSNLTNYYSMIPVKQAKKDTLQFGAAFSNIGAANQPNSIISNIISTPTGTTTLISTGITSVPGTTDSVYLSQKWTPNQGVGQYNMVFVASSDSTDAHPNNNSSDSINIIVTDTTYARDRNASGNSWYGAGSSFEIGCKYTFYDTAIASSISIQVGSASTIGEPISVYLYDESNMNTALAFKEFIILSAADIGNIITIPIPNTTLPPGSYVATFKSYSDQVFFTTSPQSADPYTVYVDPSAGGTWFYANSIPVARLNIKPQLSSCNSSISFALTSSITCPLATDGAVQVNVSAGNSPYSYSWSNGSISDTSTNVSSGWQTVTITDNNACVTVDSFFVPQPNPISANFIIFDSVSCNGMNDGIVTTTPTGGSAPYSFLWSTNASIDSLKNISAGTYSITITDQNQCSITDSVIVTEPLVLSNSLAIIHHQKCIGISNGVASNITVGGTTPYSYLWSNAETTAQAIALDTGWNMVTITDYHNCVVTDSVQIADANNINVNIGSDTILCHNASYTLNAGNSSFASYLWNTGATNGYLNVNTFIPDTLIYSVSATDTNGCISKDSSTIIVKGPISAEIIGDTALCAYDSTLLTTVQSYATYYWSNFDTNSQTMIQARNYNAGFNSITVTVADSHQCAGQAIFNFEVYPEVVVDLGPDTGILYLSGITQYILDPGSGFNNYLWQDGSTNQTYISTIVDPSNLYTVIVTDSNNCMGTDSVFVDWIGNVISLDAGIIKVFPNPATYNINVDLSKLSYKGFYQLRMFNLAGLEVLYKSSLNSNFTEKIDISNLTSGTYFIQIGNSKWSETIPITIK